MKRFLITGILACCFSAPSHAQSISVGATGGGSFGSLFFGPSLEIKLPLKALELDARDTFAPIESHEGLGRSQSNVLTLDPTLWVKRGFGLDGEVSLSEYHAGRVSKHEDYAFGGIGLRGNWLGAPAEMRLDYFREFNNGLYNHGLETSHLQGGSLYLEAQIGCAHHICYYTTLETSVGTLLEQGNPLFDGSDGRPCRVPRIRTVNGSGIMGLLLRWGR